MNNIVVTVDEHTENSITEAEASIKEAKDALLNDALSALEATDKVAIRCWKANVAYPVEWQAYTEALRAILNGGDTTSTSIPAMPSYPVGT